ncbi:hypothetical protein ACER0A_008195 [Haloimpatiens sp. FM7315]|uniref:hypothetical protein n=1 Tax=Haloimpatiens sp. FM7315 TaxID=3298609 RepID=UPI0035A35390
MMIAAIAAAIHALATVVVTHVLAIVVVAANHLVVAIHVEEATPVIQDYFHSLDQEIPVAITTVDAAVAEACYG